MLLEKAPLFYLSRSYIQVIFEIFHLAMSLQWPTDVKLCLRCNVGSHSAWGNFFPPVCKEGFPPWQPLCIHDGATLVGAVDTGTVCETLLPFPVLHTPGGYQRNWCAIQFKTHVCVYASGQKCLLFVWILYLQWTKRKSFVLYTFLYCQTISIWLALLKMPWLACSLCFVQIFIRTK